MYMNNNNKQTKLAVFQDKKIRRVWDEKSEQWYFSIVDIVETLSGSGNPTDYLKKMRKRDPVLGSYLGTKCPHVEMAGEGGKKRKVLAGNVENILRLVQSIPSSKAEPFKLWLAKVGYERLQEMNDPEKAIDRSRAYWQKLGRSNKWIQQRMMSQETRAKLTDYWKTHGVREGNEFALLTNVIHQEWTGLTVGQHKELKRLKTENLRDHMSEAELIFTALAEFPTRQIAQTDKAEGLPKNIVAGKKGGNVAKKARLDLETRTGVKVVTGDNFKPALKGPRKSR